MGKSDRKRQIMNDFEKAANFAEAMLEATPIGEAVPYCEVLEERPITLSRISDYLFFEACSAVCRHDDRERQAWCNNGLELLATLIDKEKETANKAAAV